MFNYIIISLYFNKLNWIIIIIYKLDYIDFLFFEILYIYIKNRYIFRTNQFLKID